MFHYKRLLKTLSPTTVAGREALLAYSDLDVRLLRTQTQGEGVLRWVVSDPVPAFLASGLLTGLLPGIWAYNALAAGLLGLLLVLVFGSGTFVLGSWLFSSLVFSRHELWKGLKPISQNPDLCAQALDAVNASVDARAYRDQVAPRRALTNFDGAAMLALAEESKESRKFAAQARESAAQHQTFLELQGREV